jgi:hypothetical protein
VSVITIVRIVLAAAALLTAFMVFVCWIISTVCPWNGDTLEVDRLRKWLVVAAFMFMGMFISSLMIE